LFAVKAAAAVTSPAASMLRAIGFWASSAAFSPASRSAADIGVSLDLEPPFFAFWPLDFPPEFFDFAISQSPVFVTQP